MRPRALADRTFAPLSDPRQFPEAVQGTATETATAVAATGVSSPELAAVFATGFVVLAALVVLSRPRS
jgi:hypothetical protein